MPSIDFRESLRSVRTLLALIAVFGILGCATAPLPQSELPAQQLSDNNDVVLLPTEDFPFDFAANLARVLSIDTGLKIRATLNLGTGDWRPYSNVAQYDPARLKEIALPTIAQLKKSYGGTLYVLLTTKDLNASDGNLRFVFAESYPQDNISVISLARMMFTQPGRAFNEQLVSERVRKMVLRSIGLMYFGVSRSADPRNLMYSPLMSLDALDGLEPVLRR